MFAAAHNPLHLTSILRTRDSAGENQEGNGSKAVLKVPIFNQNQVSNDQIEPQSYSCRKNVRGRIAGGVC